MPNAFSDIIAHCNNISEPDNTHYDYATSSYVQNQAYIRDVSFVKAERVPNEDQFTSSTTQPEQTERKYRPFRHRGLQAHRRRQH